MPTKRIERINFGKIEEVIKPPNLIEIQVDSYREFLQIKNQEGEDIDPRMRKRRRIGLQAVFEEIFPVKSYDEKCELDFLFYEIGKPKVSWLECLREGLTFGASLHVMFRLQDKQGAKEEKVFMGDIPLMTPQGTFIVNGAERVIVSQLHRSPGLAFEATQHPNGKMLHSFRIIPDRGSWYEAQFDTNDMLWVYLDRKKRRRKFLATTFFRALGCSSDAEILKLFYEVEELPIKKLAKLDDVEIQNRVPAEDVMDLDNGGKVAHAFEPLSKEKVKKIASTAKGVQKIRVVNISFDGGIIIKCLKKDPTKNEEEALKDIYRRLRPGDPPTIANARTMIQRLFFDSKRYDLGGVGRYKINQKLGVNHWSDEGVEELDLSASITDCLKKENVETVRDLVRRQRKDLISTLPRWSDEGVETLRLRDSITDCLKKSKVETVRTLARMPEEDLLKNWGLYVESKIQDYLREAKIKTVRGLVEKTRDQLRDSPGYTGELFKGIEDRLENYGNKQGVKIRIGMPSLAQQKKDLTHQKEDLAQRRKALEANVDEIGLSAFVADFLKEQKVETVETLARMPEEDLWKDWGLYVESKIQDYLKKAKIKTVGDLVEKTEKQLQDSSGYTGELFKRIEDRLERYGNKQCVKIRIGMPSLPQRREVLSQQTKVFNANLDGLEFSEQIRECLEEYKIRTVKELVEKKRADLLDQNTPKQTLDAEDVKEIEEKLEGFGRENDVDLHLGMSPLELDRQKRELDKREKDLERLERALEQNIDEIFLNMDQNPDAEDVKEIEKKLEGFGRESDVDLHLGMSPLELDRLEKDLNRLERALKKKIEEIFLLRESGKWKKMLDANVEKIGLSERIREYLKGNKIRTVKELVGKKRADLLGQNTPKQTKTRPTIKDLYDLFDSDEKASQKQIQKNYQKEIRKFHPDHYAPASKELRAKAEEWTKRINEANDILKEYRETKIKPKQLDGKNLDYWNAKKYWGESGKQILDDEDVKEIEEKLEEFGRKNDVDLHLGMSRDEFLTGESMKKVDKDVLGKYGEEMVKEIGDALRKYGEKNVRQIEDVLREFGEKRFPNFYTDRFVDLRLGMEEDDLTVRVLNANDLVEATKYLLRLKTGKEGSVDDIDHLGSRRARTVGELLANQCRVGLARTERLVKERMTLFDQGLDTMSPQKLINPKALSSVVRDFFGRSQLSQFMDQINPLAELTHKRRLSALGPGGLSRERAGFEVRDVHPSHYGRICPIETPEGPNIGLIASLAAFARVNDYGFIETPYRKVNKGQVPRLTEQTHRLELKIQDYLKEAKIKTVGDLVEKTEKQLRDYPGYTGELFKGIEDRLEHCGKNHGVKIRVGMPFLPQRKKALNANLDGLEFSEQIRECLKESKIRTVKELVGKTRTDLLDQNTPRQTLDAEDVKEIEEKLEGFGRENDVDLHLGMSPLELDRQKRELDKREKDLERLERALKQKIDEIFLLKYLTADQEEKHVVAQANTSIKGNGELERAMCRQKRDFLDVDPLECRTCKKNPDNCRCEEGFNDSVHYMDVSPKQLVSVAAGLIPFLEHDDANRALMGSNMQRQAVPLLVTESPFVGTGLEKLAAQDSRSVVVANDLKEGGEYKVASVNLRLPGRKRREKEDNSRYIVITKDGKIPERRRLRHNPENGIYLYQLRKFMRSNAATCINQKPLVAKGQIVKKGDVIADGPCTDNGELALGRNVLCAFMPWNGYNFEDAVLISRRIVKDDVFTSIHIDEFEVNARDTKLGPEEITRDIPNLGEEALKDLGADGIIREGAEVKPGDILVGKVTPKSETELAPEEKLLRAIFGEKAADVKDSSLRVPSGTYGIVMEVRDVKKENGRPSRSERSESKKQARQIREDYERKRKELLNQLTEKLSGILLGEKIPLEVCNSETAEIIIPANKKITKTLLKKLAKNYDRLLIPPSPIRNKILEIIEPFKPKFEDLQSHLDEDLEREESGVEEEETGVVKSVKVFIASKRKLSVGDKMAGRHGNKGVVAQIVPEEDMPFLANGTPVDIVLNPLGVPSRMNVGQVLETHLGWAAKILGVSFATPIFDGIKEKGEEKKNEERETLHNLLKKWKDESLSVDSSQKEKEKLREKLREYGVRDYLKAADDLVKGEDGVAWDFGMASLSSNGSADEKKKKRGCSLVKEDGKAVLYDGRTGDPFNQEVVVGYIYMLKLGHLVADKIHARAVGPYSLVTQQPLGGKAQYGGQRFGEMEVWAMEAYGAAHALQELITVKSDDVHGRTDIYASVVNGDNSLNASVPESFNVLVKEIQSLGMDVQVGYVRGRERPRLPSLVAASPTLDSESEEPHRV